MSLDIHHISKIYNNQLVLRNVTFTVQCSEPVGLIGPNGSGKITFFIIIAHLVRPIWGGIFFDGSPLELTSSNILGYMPDISTFSGLGEYEVYEFLYFCLKLRHTPSSLAKTRVQELMKSFNLWDYRHQALKTFSAGMKQKVYLIQALLTRPKILLLDEPFTSLDVSSRENFLQWILQSMKEHDCCIIISSHELLDLFQLVTRLVYIDKGRVLSSVSATSFDHVYKFEKYCELIPLSGSFDWQQWWQDNCKDFFTTTQFISVGENRFLLKSTAIYHIEEVLKRILENNRVIIKKIENIKNFDTRVDPTGSSLAQPDILLP